MAQPIDLRFPMGGLNRRYGYQSQPPFTTPDCNNVRPITGADRRARGGSRPGLSKVNASQFGSSGSDRPFQFITSVSAIDNERGIYDPFNGTSLSADWTTMFGLPPTVSGGALETPVGGSFRIRRTTDVPATSSVQSVEIEVVNGQDMEYRIAIRGTGTSLATFHGLEIRFRFAFDYLASNTYYIDVYEYHGAGAVSVSSNSYTDPGTPATTALLKVVTTGSGFAQCKAYFRGVEKETCDATSSVGAGMATHIQAQDNLGSQIARVNSATLTWENPNDRTRNIWVCQGNLYVERESIVRGFTSQYTSDSRWIAHTQYRGDLYTMGTQGLKYDYVLDYPTAWTASVGTLPTANILATWQDRVVAAEQHAVYLSRSGDPRDWDTGADETDEGRAVALTTLEETGDWVTALIPASRDVLLVAKSRSIYALLGNPAAGGQVIRISHNIGILNPHAWCKSPDGVIYFMSYDGLYAMAGPQAMPQPLLQNIDPQLRPDPDTDTGTLVYDQFAEGVHIFGVESNNTVGDYFYHTPTGSLWPFSIPSSMAMRSIGGAAAVETTSLAGSRIWIGCKDGYLRRFDTAATNDDGTAITSYVTIGPILLGDPLTDGRMDTLDCILTNGSGVVSWEMRVGSSGYAAYSAASAMVSGTFSQNRNVKSRPWVGGNAATIKLSSTAIWSMEQLIGTRSLMGPTRL